MEGLTPPSLVGDGQSSMNPSYVPTTNVMYPSSVADTGPRESLREEKSSAQTLSRTGAFGPSEDISSVLKGGDVDNESYSGKYIISRKSSVSEAVGIGLGRSRIGLLKPAMSKVSESNHTKSYWETVLDDSTETTDSSRNCLDLPPTSAISKSLDTQLQSRHSDLKPLLPSHYIGSVSPWTSQARPTGDTDGHSLGTPVSPEVQTSSSSAGSPVTPAVLSPSILQPRGDNTSVSESAIQVKSFVCRDCKVRFATRIELSTHSGVCPSRAEDRPFKCSHCGACFRKNSNLMKHISLVELKLRPHACSLCDSTFGQKSNLTAHIRTIHNGERKYACNVDGCNRRFGQNSGLRAHIRTVHLGARDFVCECSRRFGSRGDLNRHIRSTHQKLTPYTCKECGKSFSRKSVLSRHEAAIHGNSAKGGE